MYVLYVCCFVQRTGTHGKVRGEHGTNRDGNPIRRKLRPSPTITRGHIASHDSPYSHAARERRPKPTQPPKRRAQLIRPEGAAPEPKGPTQKPPATRLNHTRKRKPPPRGPTQKLDRGTRTARKHDEAKHEVSRHRRSPGHLRLNRPYRERTLRTWSYARQRPCA